MQGLPWKGRQIRGRNQQFGWALLFAMLLLAACHPTRSRKGVAGQGGPMSAQDSLLCTQFPLPEHLLAQKELLLKHSVPAKRVIQPDGTYLDGHINSGVAALVLDEIDGEPSHFFGHLEGTEPEEQIVMVVYGIPNAHLDKLVAGEVYWVHWIETVAYMKPFDDDRYRNFVAYRIERR